MRNLSVIFIVVCAWLWPICGLAQTPMGIPPEIMRRLSLSYDLNTLYPKDLDGVNFSGFGVGYAMDFPVSDSRPVYVGAGIDFRFVFRTKTYSQTEQYNLVNIKQRTSFIHMNVPVNVGYIFPLGGGVSVMLGWTQCLLVRNFVRFLSCRMRALLSVCSSMAITATV